MNATSPYVALKRQANILPVSSRMVDEYWELFINNPEIFNLQTETPGKNNKHYYYRPKHNDINRMAWRIAWRERPSSIEYQGGCQAHRDDAEQIYKRITEERGLSEFLSLRREDVERHLAGHQTINCFSTNPSTQNCKWIAIDADYEAGRVFADLAKLKYDLSEVGIQAFLEHSRRGGHLWILAAEPLPAALCRTFVFNLALRLDVPIKGHRSEVEGIEIFPRQNRLEKGYFGNAIRGPLGVHRATMKRYWFEGAPDNLEAQFHFLRNVKRMTLAELEALTYGMDPIEEVTSSESPAPFIPRTWTSSSARPTFDIR